MRLLVIGEQAPIELVRLGLRDDGLTIEPATGTDLRELDDRLRRYDAILLDQHSLQEPGWSHLARWRREGLEAQILVLLPEDSDGAVRAAYLDAGADICLMRPLSVEELRAHMRALKRRTHLQKSPVRRVHDLEINSATRSAIRAGRPIHLTPREFDLLQLLANHPGKVLSRSTILEHLYNDPENGTSNVVDVYVGYLRNKIDKGFKTPLILTRWGQGYLLRPEGA